MGSSKYRSNIFGKHNLVDGTQNVLKSIVGANSVKNNVPSKIGKSIHFEEEEAK